MECVAKKCSVTNIYDDAFLTCWLCDCHAHVKCAGFMGRHFDKITSRESGLRWSCWNCRDYEVDFYRLFKEAKMGFSNLHIEFNSLYGKFKLMEEMFNKFKWPENLSTSPKGSNASGESIVEQRKNNIPATPNVDNLMVLSPLPPAFGLNVNTPSPASNPTMESLDTGAGAIHTSATASVVDDQSSSENTQPSCSNSIAETDNLQNPVLMPGAALESGTISQIVTEPIPQTKVVPRNDDLVVVPPRRTVFVSRLSADTTVDRIVNYIKSHSPQFNDSDGRVLKFNNYQNRDISSFKIIVPDKLFRILIEQSFWPMGVLVREFTRRDRPARSVPVNLQSSKN